MKESDSNKTDILKCPQCGEKIDTDNLGQVVEHYFEHHDQEAYHDFLANHRDRFNKSRRGPKD